MMGVDADQAPGGRTRAEKTYQPADVTGIRSKKFMLEPAVMRPASPPPRQTAPTRSLKRKDPPVKTATSSPYLKWKSPEGHELTFALSADEVVIGRKSDADIVLPNPYVSRQHARLIKENEGYRIVDLRSTHGTYVNGQRIEMCKLQYGDHISVGQDRLELLYLARTAQTTRIEIPEANDFEKSFNQLAAILPAESSDLEKISSVLDFQYQWGKS